MNRKGILIVVSGFSGSGKGTLMKELLSRYPDTYALSISATTNPLSHLAMQQLEKLKHCDVHSSVILSDVDSDTFRRLHMYLTCEDRYQSDDSLYHK